MLVACPRIATEVMGIPIFNPPTTSVGTAKTPGIVTLTSSLAAEYRANPPGIKEVHITTVLNLK